MEKFLEYLQEAEKTIKIVDHIIYVTFPLIKDKRLLLKIISEIKKVLAYCINSILQHEYLFKKIKLYKDAKSNFQTFINKSSKRFDINNKEIKQIINLFEIVEAHKYSSMEFIKDEKVFILGENMKQESISLEKTKEFLILAKEILKKTKNKIFPYN
ncbi:MAG: hypothetical protein ABIH59_03230 [archaeon]